MRQIETGQIVVAGFPGGDVYVGKDCRSWPHSLETDPKSAAIVCPRIEVGGQHFVNMLESEFLYKFAASHVEEADTLIEVVGRQGIAQGDKAFIWSYAKIQTLR